MAVKRGKTKAKENKAYSKGLLMENFVLLQETLVETVAAMKEVNGKINSLLGLFESASKKFTEGKPMGSEVSVRLQTIEDQNRVIARTLLLLRKQLQEQQRYGVTKELSPSILSKPKSKKKRKISKADEADEGEEETDEGGTEGTGKDTSSLFEEEFGTEEGTDEDTGESGSSGSEDEYRPKPLPEFSF